MSLVPFLILAKQAEKQKKVSYKTQKKKEENKDITVNVSNRKHAPKEHNYHYHLYDKRFKEIFEKLSKMGLKKDEISKEKCLELFVDFSKKYFDAEKKVIEKLSVLEKEGISITETYRTKSHYYPVQSNNSQGFNGLDIGYNQNKSFVSGFNGIKITEEMLLDETKNPYEEEYKAWENQNENILEKESQLEQTIIAKKKKLKFSLLKRDEKKLEIEQLEKELNELKLKIEEGKQKKNKMAIFNNLTSTQKIKLLDYFKCVAECENLGSKIKQIIDAVVAINKNYNYKLSSETKIEEQTVKTK